MIVSAAGCAGTLPAGRSPLLPPRMHPDSVALEITFLRFPLGESEFNDDLWPAVDEQHISPATRQALARQGMRAGVLPGILPSALERLMAGGEAPLVGVETTLDNFEPDARVTTKHMQARAGKRIELSSSGTIERLTVFEPGADGSLAGREFENAECRFAIIPEMRADGGVTLRVQPELHYGELRPQWTSKPEMGLMVFESARSKKVFDELRFSLSLAPGDLLIMGTPFDRSGSLGHHFFTTRGTAQGQVDQKLLLVRLVQTQSDAAFAEITQTAPNE